MSEHSNSFKDRWARWFEVDGLLPMLHGGFRRHERPARQGEDMGFAINSSLCLGVGVARLFKMV